ncbi:hypothetical protein ACTHGU_05150 [Chitinophagaceae bacterium MMS25-I14]
MSYDLTVFRPEAAPKTRSEFYDWFNIQAKWSEDHGYNNPAVTSDELRSWFMEMIKTFPALSGPYAIDDPGDGPAAEYCIGKDLIYVNFPWSFAEKAYEVTKAIAERHKVGFYDTSANDGDILFPADDGRNHPIDSPGNLSSIQQIRNMAQPGQEGKSVQDILYSKMMPQILEQIEVLEQKAKNKRNWWRRLFGRK